MIGKVRQSLRDHLMLGLHDSVLVGLSGGADSVSLLHALLELKDEFSLAGIRAVHINHGIRGEEAGRDERFCRELCLQLDIPLDCVRLDIPAIAAQLGIGLEECGRQCRYEHFRRIARNHGCVIATAHTLSDSVETVIFNLARGSALGGVAGIPAVRMLDDTVRVIRPLIGVTRAEVERYCAQHRLSYVTDGSNADTVYRRNLIRQQVIPALLQVNPALHSAVERFTDCAAGDDAYLNRLAVEALEAAAAGENCWDAATLSALPYPLLRRALVSIARTRGCTPEFSQVQLCASVLFSGSGAVMLTRDVRLAVGDGFLRLDTGAAPAPWDHWEFPAEYPSTVLPGGRELVFEKIELNEPFATQKHQKLLFKNAISCGIIKDNISVRNRREGDRFAPAGRGVNRKLKKFLCDEGVPAEQRSSLAIIAGEGGILWLEGFGASELARPADGDRTVIVPSVRDKSGRD